MVRVTYQKYTTNRNGSKKWYCPYHEFVESENAARFKARGKEMIVVGVEDIKEGFKIT